MTSLSDLDSDSFISTCLSDIQMIMIYYPQCLSLIQSLASGLSTGNACKTLSLYLYEITWSDPKEACLWVDGPQVTVLVKLHPADVVSHALDLVAGQGRVHHGKVCLATCTRERCSYVVLTALRVSDSKDLQTDL